jgi:hypothetical protein
MSASYLRRRAARALKGGRRKEGEGRREKEGGRRKEGRAFKRAGRGKSVRFTDD